MAEKTFAEMTRRELLGALEELGEPASEWRGNKAELLEHVETLAAEIASPGSTPDEPGPDSVDAGPAPDAGDTPAPEPEPCPSDHQNQDTRGDHLVCQDCGEVLGGL